MSKRKTKSDLDILSEVNSRLDKEIYELRVKKRELEKQVEDWRLLSDKLEKRLDEQTESAAFYRGLMCQMADAIMRTVVHGK